MINKFKKTILVNVILPQAQKLTELIIKKYNLDKTLYKKVENFSYLPVCFRDKEDLRNPNLTIEEYFDYILSMIPSYKRNDIEPYIKNAFADKKGKL